MINGKERRFSLGGPFFLFAFLGGCLVGLVLFVLFFVLNMSFFWLGFVDTVVVVFK